VRAFFAAAPFAFAPAPPLNGVPNANSISTSSLTTTAVFLSGSADLTNQPSRVSPTFM